MNGLIPLMDLLSRSHVKWNLELIPWAQLKLLPTVYLVSHIDRPNSWAVGLSIYRPNPFSSTNSISRCGPNDLVCVLTMVSTFPTSSGCLSSFHVPNTLEAEQQHFHQIQLSHYVHSLSLCSLLSFLFLLFRLYNRLLLC